MSIKNVYQPFLYNYFKLNSFFLVFELNIYFAFGVIWILIDELNTLVWIFVVLIDLLSLYYEYGLKSFCCSKICLDN